MNSSSPSNPFQEFSEAWASIYPLLHWILEHPLGSLFFAFGGLYLFWGLFRGLIYVTENLWIRILRSPISLGRYLWRKVSAKDSLPPSLQQPAFKPDGESTYSRLNELIHQLEEGHRHQEHLLDLAKLELKKIPPPNS